MAVLRAALVSVLTLLTACSVGEVPSGGTPDAGAHDGGGGGGTGGGGGGGGGDAGGAGGDAGGGTGTGPGQSFDMKVKPIVTRCTACHNGSQPPNLTSYSTIAPSYITKPGASSRLVTQGPHQGQPFLTTAEQAIVAAWIDTLP